jgi:hypothetical protein
VAGRRSADPLSWLGRARGHAVLNTLTTVGRVTKRPDTRGMDAPGQTRNLNSRHLPTQKPGATGLTPSSPGPGLIPPKEIEAPWSEPRMGPRREPPEVRHPPSAFSGPNSFSQTAWSGNAATLATSP